MMRCEQCGELTTRTSSNQKYCQKCAAKAYKDRIKQYRLGRKRADAEYQAMLRRKKYGGYFALPRRSLCCDCATIFITGKGGGTRCPVCRDWRKSEESKHERRVNAATKLTEEERALSLERHRAYVREYKKTEEYKIKHRAENRKRIQAQRSRRIITDLDKIKRAINGTPKI